MRKLLTALLFFLLLPLTVNAQNNDILLLEDEQASYFLESYTVTRTNKYDQIDSISFVVNITSKQNPILNNAKVQYFFDLSHQDRPIAGTPKILLPESYDNAMMLESLKTIDKNVLLEKALVVAEDKHQQMPYNENYYFWRENNLVATYVDGNLSKPEVVSADNELQILSVTVVDYYTPEGSKKIAQLNDQLGNNANLVAYKETYQFNLGNNSYILVKQNWQYNDMTEKTIEHQTTSEQDWLNLYPETASNETLLAQNVLVIGLLHNSYTLNKVSLPLTLKDIADWSPEKYDINLKQ